MGKNQKGFCKVTQLENKSNTSDFFRKISSMFYYELLYMKIYMFL